MSQDPVKDCLKAGIAALLRGDTAERDRQIERARKIMDAQEAVPNMDLSNAQAVELFLKFLAAKIGRALTGQEIAAIRAHPAYFMHRYLAERSRAAN